MPSISFPAGSTHAVAVPVNISYGGSHTVGMPEPAVLRRMLPRHIYGRQLNAALNPPLQRLTAWGTAGLLRAARFSAVQRDAFVDLPSVTLLVEEWCSGLVSIKWLLLMALALIFIGRSPWPWKVALVVIAPLVAIEANVLRIAAVGAAYELGYNGWALKDWLGWAAISFGVVQIVGLKCLSHRLHGRG
jgi:exosortase/archaeosortase family protein